jgi:predicted  nucleic acid-binding Zn-ribbon protein
VPDSNAKILARLDAIEEHAEALNGEVRDLRTAMTATEEQTEATRVETEATRAELADVTEATRVGLAGETETARSTLAAEAAIEKRRLDRLLSDKLFRTRGRAVVFGVLFGAAGFSLCALLGF